MADCIDHGRCGSRSTYATLRRDGKQIRWHRAILEDKLGRALASDEVARHTCDNKRCINPEHVVVGGVADNNRDAWERRQIPMGEQRRDSKLTLAQVREIRATYVPRHPEFGQTALAKRFNVARTTVNSALHTTSWRHV